MVAKARKINDMSSQMKELKDEEHRLAGCLNSVERQAVCVGMVRHKEFRVAHAKARLWNAAVWCAASGAKAMREHYAKTGQLAP